MKLAEALILRADTQKRIHQLRERLARSARVQEGEQPPENPQDLFAELERALDQLTALVRQINRTNAQTLFSEGVTLTDALAERDRLKMERELLAGTIQDATGTSPNQMMYNYNFRVTHSEIKFLSTISIAGTQRRVNDLARRHRELDSRIQEMNWSVDLLE